jgi:hypothetical protein
VSQDELIADLGSFAYDPYAFVMWAFPWGVPGTELAKETGPDEWQTWLLCSVRDKILSLDEAIRIGVTSGHGVGKSAVVSWLVWWSYSTFPGTRGVVTANTEVQLKTKTWVEIAKWHRLFIARSLFKCTATAIFSVDEEQAREWRIDIVPWSERNTEAFAGLHNAGKRLIIIFDEASAIPDIIWETTEGALTDEKTEILWFVFGNPTRQSGRFRECFPGGKFASRWLTREIDSRSVKRTNKKQLNDWIADYGLDSDFVRVRILGKFPKTDSDSFIDRDVAVGASVRNQEVDEDGPVIIGVDVARFGDDLTVLWPRRGLDARTLPIQAFSGLDTVQVTQRVIRLANDLNAAAIMVDETGVGAGVLDQLINFQLPAYGVVFGANPDGFEPNAVYMNKRAEIWGSMRNWLRRGMIPPRAMGRDIIEDLTTPTYSIHETRGIQLESKALIKSRAGQSPDFGDALALTFGFPIEDTPKYGGMTKKFLTDYDPLSLLETL